VQDSEGRMSETPPPRRLELKRRSATGGVLVLGGGFAGGYVARGLGERGATIVSPDNSLTFSPLLPEAASGTLELRHVAVPLRMMCPHADLVLGRAAAHDPEARKVTVSTDSGERVAIGYEQLVIALGAVPRTFPIPGLLEHAVGAKTIADAIYLRDRVLRQLEAASIESDADRRRGQLTCVFVGGGYAGVETLAELHDFAQDALRYFPTLRGVEQRWLLLDAAPRMLAEIPTRLGEYATEELIRAGIDVRTETSVERAEPGRVVLTDGTELACETLVWTAGVRANPILQQLRLPLDERGRVAVDEHLRVRGLPRVWALGDCAAVPNAASAGRPDPPTSQHAIRQASALARNLAAVASGGPLRRYRYRSLGQVATLGRFKGIAVVLGLQLRGPLGWWVARTVHLLQIPQRPRQLRVLGDWTFSLLFRRDIVAFGAQPPRPPLVTNGSDAASQP
jgi:NADH:ubiquinone reductase (H+-translocating)